MPSKNADFIAYELHRSAGMPLIPAPATRDWMDESTSRFSYRCLPLVVANQAGWMILNPTSFSVRWNGGPRQTDLRIRFAPGRRDDRVLSHFGCGVLTLSIPYLFRTPRGINLWVKGPTNRIKDGIQALEGVVETDWSPASFTMNWRLTRPDQTVRFERGEPICMLVPIPRGLAESLHPQLRPITRNKRLESAHRKWMRSRGRFIEALNDGVRAAVRRGWQKHYFLGLTPDGRPFEEHQTRLHLKEFSGKEPISGASQHASRRGS